MEFFTNKKKTKEGDVDITSPAFSITKVQVALGLLITGIVGVLPPALKENEAVMIASIAAASLVMLGVFALSAVDIKTRQRAAEAQLRFGGGGGGGSKSSFEVMPVEENLIIQKGHNADEYEVRFAAVKKGGVDLLAARDGEFITVPFKKTPKSR
jgi:hypothetical protein